MTASRTTALRPASRGRSSCATPRAGARWRTARVVRPGDKQTVEPGAPGVEQVAGAVLCDGDVGDECEAFGAHLQATDDVEVGVPVGEEVDDRERHFFVATRGFELGPGTAVHQAVFAGDCGVHPLQGTGIR
jgi:hypothetical protein